MATENLMRGETFKIFQDLVEAKIKFYCNLLFPSTLFVVLLFDSPCNLVVHVILMYRHKCSRYIPLTVYLVLQIYCESHQTHYQVPEISR